MIAHYEYYYDDDTIDAFLYMRTNIPKNSTIMGPNFIDGHLEIYVFFYYYYELNKSYHEWKIYINNFDINTTFIEFEKFIIALNIDFLLINKQNYNQSIYSSFEASSDYQTILENNKYYLYKVI